MKTVHDILRERILSNFGLFENNRRILGYDDALVEVIDFTEEPLKLALARLIIGIYRYGRLTNRQEKYDYIAFIKQRLRKYEETKNQDFLLDALNGCLLEFGFPSMKGTHYSPLDDHNFHNQEI